MVPGYPDTLHRPGFPGLVERLEGATRFFQHPDVVCIPHIMDLPEPQMVASDAGERTVKVLFCFASTSLSGFARLEGEFLSVRVLCPESTVILLASRICRCRIVVADTCLVCCREHCKCILGTSFCADYSFATEPNPVRTANKRPEPAVPCHDDNRIRFRVLNLWKMPDPAGCGQGEKQDIAGIHHANRLLF